MLRVGLGLRESALGVFMARGSRQAGAKARMARARGEVKRDPENDQTSWHRLMLRTLYPPIKPQPVVTIEQQERRQFIAKTWSRFTRRREHELQGFLRNMLINQTRARAQFKAMYPEAYAAADEALENIKHPFFPVERREPMDTPPTWYTQYP